MKSSCKYEADESYWSVVPDLPNLTQPMLMSIHKDSQRQQWYLDTEAHDEHVDAALEAVR